jgi:hypothetical protein
MRRHARQSPRAQQLTSLVQHTVLTCLTVFRAKTCHSAFDLASKFSPYALIANAKIAQKIRLALAGRSYNPHRFIFKKKAASSCGASRKRPNRPPAPRPLAIVRCLNESAFSENTAHSEVDAFGQGSTHTTQMDQLEKKSHGSDEFLRSYDYQLENLPKGAI